MAWLTEDWRGQSGPAVARLFHRALALVVLDAWISLGVQVHVLIGRRGLMPIEAFLEAARASGIGARQLPTLLWWNASDGMLTAGVVLGVALALAGLAGAWPRLCWALSLPLYLSYAVAGRTFLSFQWDNLLLECLLLAIFLPRDRDSRWAHALFRLLLFKLYFESGIAKWQSQSGDWQDGSAMTWYYQTAPLPTAIAWYAHHLPVWWHHFESRATLFLELVLPFGIFTVRPVRLLTFAALTGFQLVNLATANYGFFCHLTLAMHLFLLDEDDARRISAWVRARLGRPRRVERYDLPGGPEAALGYAAGSLVCTAFVVISLSEAVAHFGPEGPGKERYLERIAPLQRVWEPLRLVNTYHLFGSITTERVEPTFEESDGERWVERGLRYKPGDPRSAPRFVAPHQPRVDFQLWFYGLSFRRGGPEYVHNLLDRMCHDPAAVAGLFGQPLLPAPRAVRILYYRTRFTTAEERRASGQWWEREPIGRSPEVSCEEVTATPPR